MPEDRQYTPEDVTAIVAGALRRHRDRESISHEELLETAAELGLSRHEVEKAAEHLATERDMEHARDRWLAHQRVEFRQHLVSYLIINAFLFTIDVMVSGGAWFMWPLLGWGVGLAFHAYAVFFPDPEEIEKGALKILDKEPSRWARY